MSSVSQHKWSFITIKDSSNCSAIRTTSNSLFRYSILLSTKLKSSNKLILKPKSHNVSSTSNHAENTKNLKNFQKLSNKNKIEYLLAASLEIFRQSIFWQIDWYSYDIAFPDPCKHIQIRMYPQDLSKVLFWQMATKKKV